MEPGTKVSDMALLGMPENESGRRSRKNHGINGLLVVDEKSRLAPLLIKNGRRSAGLNYSLVVEGSDTLVYPEILGIDSRPSLQTIIDYAAENPAP